MSQPDSSPSVPDSIIEYTTRGGARVRRTCERASGAEAIAHIARSLDRERGVLLASSYEYPGRYTRWDIGFTRPLLALEGRGRAVRIEALRCEGEPIVQAIGAMLREAKEISHVDGGARELTATASPSAEFFAEEERTRRPTVLSVVRIVRDFFQSSKDAHLGLYGAFGYDLAFQFEPIRLARARPVDQRELVLYLPDEIVVVDHARSTAFRYRYTIEIDGFGREARAAEAEHAACDGEAAPQAETERAHHPPESFETCDHAPGEYAAMVRSALDAFARGDLFEVTTGQTFSLPAGAPPSAIFAELRRRNPAPYGFLVNLGGGEHLVGASPEMYVRVEGDRVETCPIAGTIARGRDPLEDADQIRRLLGSAKDEAELTMCTDVDRNDKSRICRPGSVRVLGRRQIEAYSKLFHTVDHVEGRLREGYDALDAFLAHTWAVTVTGAPKTRAMQFIEDHEKSPREYYGGAVGRIRFDGDLDTGLILRTIHLRDGIARVRAGATQLFASDPDEEERETRLKAAALLDVVRACSRTHASTGAPKVEAIPASSGRRVLLLDHEDSFVHTLAGYFRECGAEVVTVRARRGALDAAILRAPHLVVLSPGPGRPSDFAIAHTLATLMKKEIPVFGVCLGLQGIVEYCGGSLGQLETPRHGVASEVRVTHAGRLFGGLPEVFVAGRYHSLFARKETLPAELRITAESDDGVVMAIEHVALPMAAVQFHPESVMTLAGGHGRRIVENALTRLARSPAVTPPG